jgi:pro-kumamolisin-like protein/Big-like domain-containing protein
VLYSRGIQAGQVIGPCPRCSGTPASGHLHLAAGSRHLAEDKPEQFDPNLLRGQIMRFLKSSFFHCALLLVSTLISPSRSAVAQTTNIPARITQAVDEKSLAVLSGNVHPLARQEFDHGVAPLDLPMERMLLVLKRSPEQESALQKLLDDQQDRSSPRYRQWLTPEQFGQRFGPSDIDIQKVTDWLRGHRFQNVQVSRGRTVIEFSGAALQVEETFGTFIHKFVVNGEEHWANASDPTIPAALAPVVEGILTLHNFFKQPQVHVTENQITASVAHGSFPQFTSSAGLHALTPFDYYKIYNFNPTQPYGPISDRIAIVARSNINLQDVGYFDFWLLGNQAGSPQVIVNGPDPGDLGGGEEMEAVLDTTWAGAITHGSVLLVVSKSTASTDGVDLSELYIIDNNLAGIMSESFGDCEANFTSTQAAGIASLAAQAATQGITYVVAAGDSGSAGCDNPHTETLATHPASVNALAATPYTVAVGGTMFNENGHDSTYWSSTNDPNSLSSALSYIPEDVWNESCTSCSKAGIWAGGGGASTFFTKPSWQTGVPGIPADTARHLPDVSLTAAGHDPYLLCFRGSCIPNAQNQISFVGVSGTSAAAPAFAGILSLVGQKVGVRLGQPNYVLYRLASVENLSQCNASNTVSLPPSTCVFNDITVGNNSVPGEPGYGTSSASYQSGKGYDQAAGLGSVNVNTLINQWETVTFNPTTTAFSISPTTATHGDPLSVTLSVTPNSGTATPTGVAWLLQSSPYAFLVGDNTVDIFPLDAKGNFSGVTHLLPGGTYQVNAHYAGDGTYAGSDSSPLVPVTIHPENTTITFSVLTTDANGNFVPFTSGPYGSPVYYQAHVSGQSGYGVPTAYVNFYDNGGAGAGSVYLDKNGNALTPPLTQIAAGAHAITAAYYGDNSFNTSSNLTPINFTISHVATSTALTSQQTAQSLLLTATVSASGVGSPPTGLVTFSNGSTVLATANLTNGSTSSGTTQAAATFDGTQLARGQYSITAKYAGDTNYTASSSTAVALNLVADFTVANRGITSQTVTAGHTAQYINDIAVTPFFGFSSAVTASCTVPAQATTCSVNPNSLATTNGVNIASVVVTTTARSMTPPLWPHMRFLFRPQFLPEFLLTILLSALLLCLARMRRQRIAGALRLAGLVLFLILQTIGCGGGSSYTPPPPPRPPQTGTPANTYTVTVTATSGSLTHTTTLTLVVQ